MVDYTFAVTGEYFGSAAFKALVDDVKKANDKVDALGKTPAMDKLEASTKSAATAVGTIQSRIDGLVGAAAKFAGSFTAAWAVQQVYEFGEGVQKTAVEIGKLSRETNLSTSEVQALQQLAARTKRPFEELAETYKKNQAELDRLTGRFVETGQAIDQHAVAKFTALDRKAEESSRKMEESMNRVKAAVAPLYAEGKALVLDAAAEAMDRLVASVSKLDISKADMILALLVPGHAASLGARVIAGVADQYATEGGAKVREISADIERLQNNLKAAETRNPQGQRAQSIRGELAQRQTDLANERARQGAAIASRLGGGDNADLNRPVPLLPPSVASPPAGGGGGGGGGSRDRIGENLRLYEDQARASQKALEDLRRVALLPMPLDDLERQIKLEKDIADAEAQARKFAKDDPRIGQLREQITLRETAESQYRKLHDALKLADQTERQYGDGQREFMLTQNQLNDARDTGRLSVQGYDNALKVLGMTTEDLRLKNLGLQGGLTGFMAGWQNAQNQFERANNAFAVGGRTFDLVMSTMDQGLSQFVRNGKLELADFAGNFFLTIAQMEMRAAASSLWSMAGGGGASGGGGILSGLLGSLLGGGYSGTSGATSLYGSASSTLGSMSFGGPRAGGGPVSAGRGYIVGENGPEWFAPNSGGNVINRQQLDALGVGGDGGGSPIIVNLGGITIGGFVSQAQHRRDIMQVQKAVKEGAQEAFLEKRRRAVPSVKRAFSA